MKECGIALLILACLLLAGCQEDVEFCVESEMELSMRPDGRMVQRMWWRDFRSIDTGTNDMQRRLEKIVDEFEPAIFTRTPEAQSYDTKRFILRRELRSRGEFLDGYGEIEYPGPFADKELMEQITNGWFLMLCFTNAFHVAHNGTIIELPVHKDETMPFVAWPTNQSPIWYKETLITVTGAPLGWVYNQYVEAGRTFPWKTNVAKIGGQ